MSSEGQFWRCINPNCPPPPDPIPFAVGPYGRMFKICPFCQSPAFQVANTMQSDLTPQQPPETAVSEPKKISDSSMYLDADHESLTKGPLKETNTQCMHATTTTTTTLDEARSTNKVNGLCSNVENVHTRSEQEDSDSRVTLSNYKQESKLTGGLLLDPIISKSGEVLNDKSEVSCSVS